MYRKPKKLEYGDHIGIIVPSSPIREPFRSDGLARIRQMGFVPVEVPRPLANNYIVAKSPEENALDIEAMFFDPSIKAIWAARGGYGSNLTLPLLSRIKVAESKIVIGSSDVSYLLWYLLDHCRMVVFYGPMAYSTLAEDRVDTARLFGVLTGENHELLVPGTVLRGGDARASVTGGCLSNFVSLLGTPYRPVTEGRILLLEDTGERIHRLDRMLWQCSVAGVLDNIKGLILGQFPGCFRDKHERDYFLSRVEMYLEGIDIPVIYDAPLGHAGRVHTCPLGIPAVIDTRRYEGLVFEETAVI